MARTKNMENLANFKNGKVQEDNIYINPRIIDISELTGMDAREGVAKGLTVDVPTGSEDEDGTKEVRQTIINVMSDSYGLLRNEDFYTQIEGKLNDAGIPYTKRSINRRNRAFTVDYILQDDAMHVNIKGNNDRIKPMIRVTNSYDGSNLTAGHFGFFREICSNGLHIADLEMKFKQRHRGNVIEIVLPKVEELVAVFMSNEYYSLHRKFEVLAEKPITDVEAFVKYTLGQTKLFKYEKSEKNPLDPSLGAQLVMDIIENEAKQLGTKPNLWLGYNAFNEYIHTTSEPLSFAAQESADRKLFDAILAQVN